FAGFRSLEVDLDVVPGVFGHRSEEAFAAVVDFLRRSAGPEAFLAVDVPQLQAEQRAAGAVALELHEQVVGAGLAVDHLLDVDREAVPVFGALVEFLGAAGAVRAVTAEDQLRAVEAAGEGDATGLAAFAGHRRGDGGDNFADAGDVPVGE